MTTVRELVVKIDIKGDAGSKSKSLINGFTDIKSALELVVGAVKIAGKAIASFTTDIADSGDEIAKNAKNIGITAESLQELTFAAKLSGASAREVQTAIQRMGKGLNDARRTGTGPFNDALEQMGVSLDSFQGLSPDETFTKLAESISKIEDPLTKAALAQDVFGRGGKTLLPLINEGREGIEAMRAEFVELGGGFTNDGAAAAEEFNDALLRMTTVIDSVKIAIGTELLPVMQEMVDGVQMWLSANRELIQQKLIEFVDRAVAAFKRLLPIMGRIFDWFVDTIPEVAEFIEMLGDLIKEMGGLENVLKIAATGFIAMKVASAAALGPIGAIGLAIVALIPLIISLTDELEPLEDRLDAIADRAEEIRGKSKGKRFASEKLRQEIKDTEAAFRRAELSSRQASGSRTEEGKAAEKAFRGLSVFQQGKLAKLEATNRRLLSQQDAKSEAIAKSTGNERRFAENQQAGIRVREQLGEGRKASALVNRVIRGEITERQALDISSGKKRRGKGGGRKSRADAAVTDAELFKLISKASAEGVGLDSVLQGRKLEGGAPPVISVQVTNINVQQTVSAPVTVTGVPGEDAEDIAIRVENILEDKLQSEYREAVEELPTLIKR